MNKKINICGIPHKIIECKDELGTNTHFGLIDFINAKIYVNKALKKKSREETLCHEIVHGMLVHLGYDDLSNDEQFVQALGNAIMQSFKIKYKEE